jgi:hypothetical protein
MIDAVSALSPLYAYFFFGCFFFSFFGLSPRPMQEVCHDFQNDESGNAHLIVALSAFKFQIQREWA